MTPVMQPFHLLVIALAGWRNRHQQAVTGVVVQRKFASMLAWQMTGRCLCQLASSQRRCFVMPT